MTDLLDLIRTVSVPDSSKAVEPEDIFSDAPGLIFPDDCRNLHGDPDTRIIYQSRRFGNIELRVAEVEEETERRLFAHYLWNSSVKLAELVSDNLHEDGNWSVEKKRVLELGAGVGLGGIVATLAGASEVVMSDYPSPVVLANITSNADKALPKSHKPIHHIEGHIWGELNTTFARNHHHYFDRILAADCLWMPAEHENLIQSMLHFLSDAPDARVLVVAGFHTGRAKVAAFFDAAESAGFTIEEIHEENTRGQRREWRKTVDGGRENPTERKKWLVLARLRRSGVGLGQDRSLE